MNSAMMGIKSNVSKQSKTGNSKPVVPPRPQSVLSGNVKQQEMAQVGTKTSGSTVVSQPQKSAQMPDDPPPAPKRTTDPAISQTPGKQFLSLTSNNDKPAKTIAPTANVPTVEEVEGGTSSTADTSGS